MWQRRGEGGNQLFTSIKFDRARATSATTGESRQMPQYQSARDSWVDEHSTRFNYYSVESGYVGLESKGGDGKGSSMEAVGDGFHGNQQGWFPAFQVDEAGRKY